MEKLKKVDITEEIQKMQFQKKKRIDKELERIKKDSRNAKLDIETLEEKIPAAIRGDYFFSADKLASIIKEKEQEMLSLEEERKAILEEAKQAELENSDMEMFIQMVPNWKEEFKNADVTTKQMLLAAMIEKIEVKEDGIKIKFKIQLDNFNSIPKTIGSGTTLYRRDSA